jgi:hypothetical protein
MMRVCCWKAVTVISSMIICFVLCIRGFELLR